tara:strand:- start:4735 stop:5412 length:678 start_codon:yes stop_codon:yes gene_type:complete
MSIVEYFGKEYQIYLSPKYNDNKPKEPFHNDKKQMEIILNILNDEKLESFIETGSYMGKTVYFVGKNFPNLKCYSCEIDRNSYSIAYEQIKDLNNVNLQLVPSPDAVYNINKKFDNNIYEKKTLFWLDAHWHTDPLYHELLYITKNFKNFIIIVDDFEIPYDDGFWTDGYNIKKIKPFIVKKDKLKYYMPSYSSKDECCKKNAVGYIVITNMDINTFGHLKEITL